MQADPNHALFVTAVMRIAWQQFMQPMEQPQLLQLRREQQVWHKQQQQQLMQRTGQQLPEHSPQASSCSCRVEAAASVAAHGAA
eukprot:354820-Chlamydomonas_euryale.AAC.2